MFARITTAHVIAWISLMFVAAVLTANALEDQIRHEPDSRTLPRVLDLDRDAGPAGVILYRRLPPPADAAAGEGPPAGVEALPLAPGKAGQLSRDQLTFHARPALLVWLVFVTVMVALAVGLLPVLLVAIVPLCRRAFRTWYGVAGGVLLAAVFVAVPLKMSVDNNTLVPLAQWYELLGIGMEHPRLTLDVVSGIGALPAIVALLGMFVASGAADRLRRDTATARDPAAALEATIEQFRRIRVTLQLCLAAASSMLVMAVLTSGALREALLAAAAHRHPWLAPVEFVYLYGLMFAVVLAIVYLPVYFHVRVAGRRIFGVVTGATAADDDRIGTAETVLTGQESLANKLVSWFALAAPILGSVLPDLVSL